GSDAVAHEPGVRIPDGALLHGPSGARRVHHHVAAEVDARVATAVHDDDVAGERVFAGDDVAAALTGALAARGVRQRDAELRVDEHHEAGAVEAGRGRAAEDVGHAPVLQRHLHHLVEVEVRVGRVGEVVAHGGAGVGGERGTLLGAAQLGGGGEVVAVARLRGDRGGGDRHILRLGGAQHFARDAGGLVVGRARLVRGGGQRDGGEEVGRAACRVG